MCVCSWRVGGRRTDCETEGRFCHLSRLQDQSSKSSEYFFQHYDPPSPVIEAMAPLKFNKWGFQLWTLKPWQRQSQISGVEGTWLEWLTLQLRVLLMGNRQPSLCTSIYLQVQTLFYFLALILPYSHTPIPTLQFPILPFFSPLYSHSSFSCSHNLVPHSPFPHTVVTHTPILPFPRACTGSSFLQNHNSPSSSLHWTMLTSVWTLWD